MKDKIASLLETPVPYASSPSTICESLRVNPSVDLADAEATARRERFGESRLPDPPFRNPGTLWR